jgi:hypothetical protein
MHSFRIYSYRKKAAFNIVALIKMYLTVIFQHYELIKKLILFEYEIFLRCYTLKNLAY